MTKHQFKIWRFLTLLYSTLLTVLILCKVLGSDRIKELDWGVILLPIWLPALWFTIITITVIISVHIFNISIPEDNE